MGQRILRTLVSLALLSIGHEGLGATLLPTESNSWDMAQVAVG